jgi:hypothetical protein
MQVHPGDITSLGGVPVISGYITIVMGVISVIKERQRERDRERERDIYICEVFN